MTFYDVYEGFEQLTLSNGVSLYVQPRPNVPWFYCAILVHAGAREDPMGRQGLAHLVEHMTGENVGKLTFSEVEQGLKRLGGDGSFGETSYLDTRYYFHVSADKPSIEGALDLFGQMLLQGRLTRNIAEEKCVVAREFAQRDEHQHARIWKLQGRPVLFEDHPHLCSFDAAIGIEQEVLQSTEEEIQRYYDTYYVTDNMSLICLGQPSVQEVLSMLQQSPFATSEKRGQRLPLATPFSPREPRVHEEIIHLSDCSTITPTDAACSFEWVLPSLSPKQKRRAIETLMQRLLAKPQELDYVTERLTMAHDDPARRGLVADLSEFYVGLEAVAALDEDDDLIFLNRSPSEEQMATHRQRMRALLKVYLREHA